MDFPCRAWLFVCSNSLKLFSLLASHNLGLLNEDRCVYNDCGCRLVYKTVISLLRIIAHSLSNQLDLGTASSHRLTQTLSIV